MWWVVVRGTPHIFHCKRGGGGGGVSITLRVVGLEAGRSERLKEVMDVPHVCVELDATHILLIYGADIIKTVAGTR